MNSVGDVGVSSAINAGRVTILRMHSVSPSHAGVVYDGAVTRADVHELGIRLDDVLAWIRRVLPDGVTEHAEQYFRGLLSPIERKNGWTIADTSASGTEKRCNGS